MTIFLFSYPKISFSNDKISIFLHANSNYSFDSFKIVLENSSYS